MWRIMKGKVDENMTFMSPNMPPNLTCCMSSCNCAWIFSRNFGIWILALSDDNEYFQDSIYMNNSWHLLMVGSCVTTMNIENVGSCVNNIHFVICSLAIMIIKCWFLCKQHSFRYLFSCCYDNNLPICLLKKK